MKNKNPSETPSCCGPKKEGKGLASGLIYGLVPHTGCIAFIIFTILGVTTATTFFKPLLMSRYFFYGLILLSFIFATISAVIYLKKRSLLSKQGIKSKWKYLTTLYGTSIGVNVILFMIIFPLTANITGAAIETEGLSQIELKVDIPCPGHAPLIIESLKKVDGVKSVQYSFPDYFSVAYDSSEANQNEILSIDVFEPYPAKIVEGEQTQQETPSGCGNCGGCSGACEGTCDI